MKMFDNLFLKQWTGRLALAAKSDLAGRGKSVVAERFITHGN
jgi:hypothetical protein